MPQAHSQTVFVWYNYDNTSKVGDTEAAKGWCHVWEGVKFLSCIWWTLMHFNCCVSRKQKYHRLLLKVRLIFVTVGWRLTALSTQFKSYFALNVELFLFFGYLTLRINTY